MDTERWPEWFLAWYQVTPRRARRRRLGSPMGQRRPLQSERMQGSEPVYWPL